MKLILLAICLIALNIPTIGQIKCTIQGTVVGRPDSKMLRLSKKGENDRAVETIKINIENGFFSYDLKAPYSEIYTLTFEDELQNGVWMPIPFYATNDSVKFRLHTQDDFYKNTISSGDRENHVIMEKKTQRFNFKKKFVELKAIRKTLTKEQMFSTKGLEWRVKIDTVTSAITRNELFAERDRLMKSKEFYTPEYNILNERADSISTVCKNEEAEYDKKNPSLIVYSDLLSELRSFDYFVESYKGKGDPLDNIIERYNFLAKAYPKHIYTERCKKLIDSAKKIRIGGNYIDISAPDLDGNTIRISSVIHGKIAIIDLWASWCGPCRVTSKSYIPIYNEFKERGFTIIGIARERKNDKQMRVAIEKDGYTWTNLIELDDKNKIWETYGINNAAGGTFLVDEKGVILAINPTAQEVRKILLEKLN